MNVLFVVLKVFRVTAILKSAAPVYRYAKKAFQVIKAIRKVLPLLLLGALVAGCESEPPVHPQPRGQIRVLVFGSEWCSGCKVENRKLKGRTFKVPVAYVDVDKHPDVARKFGVTVLPTVHVLVNGVSKYQSSSVDGVIRAYDSNQGN